MKNIFSLFSFMFLCVLITRWYTCDDPSTGVSVTEISVSPPSHDFGAIDTGQYKDHAFILTNNGNSSATNVSLNTLSAPFSILNTAFETTVESTCTLSVRFAPTKVDTFTDVIYVQYFDGANNQEIRITISGIGIAPPSPARLTVNGSDTVDFGEMIIGQSAAHTFTLTKGGEFDATEVSVTGVDTPFTITGNTCAGTVTANCTTVITFAPIAAGSFTDTALVNYFDGYSAQQVAMYARGTGVHDITPAVLSANPASHDFGEVKTNTSTDREFIITKSGEANATSVVVNNPVAPFSVIKNTCQATVTSACTLTVRFTPTNAGTFNDTIKIDYFNGNSAQIMKIPFSGKGLISFTPATLTVDGSNTVNLGDVLIGTPVNHTFAISKGGTEDATNAAVTGIEVPFAITANTCTGTVTANCSLQITFTPTTEANFTDTAIVSYYDGFNNQQVTMTITGTGKNDVTPVVLSANPISFDFGEVYTGSNSEKQFTISKTGDVNATSVVVNSLTAPFAITENTCGSTIASSGTITVQFAPTAENTFQDTIAIDYFDGKTNQQLKIPVTGKGTTQQTPATLTVSGNNHVDIGDIVIGNSAIHTFNITKGGSLDATNVTVTGINSPFAITANTCTGTVTGNCSLEITFTPTIEDYFTDTAIVSYYDGFNNQQLTMTIAGTGKIDATSAVLSSNPATFDFGNVYTGSNSEKEFTITKTGDANATSVSVAGLVAPFAVTANTCGTTISNSGTITVQFSPATENTFRDTVTIVYFDGIENQQLKIPLTGDGKTPQTPATLTVSVSDDVDLGDVTIGNNKSHTFTITKGGDLDATSVTATGINSPYAITANTCTGTVTGNCSLEITFTPTVQGTFYDTAIVDYNDGYTQQQFTVKIQGTGKPEDTPATLTADPTTLDFGDVPVGSASAEKTVTFTKGGSLDAEDVTYNFSNAAFTKTGGTCGTPITQNCTIEITFTPTQAINYNGEQLDIEYSNGQGLTVHEYISLNGAGKSPAHLVISGDTTFGPIAPGETEEHSLTVTKTGDLPAATVTALSLDYPYGYKGGTCGSTINSNCIMIVEYAPNEAGTHKDTLVLRYNNGVEVSQAEINMVGVGIPGAAVLTFNPSGTYDYGYKDLYTFTDQVFTIQHSGQTAIVDDVATEASLAAPL